MQGSPTRQRFPTAFLLLVIVALVSSTCSQAVDLGPLPASLPPALAALEQTDALPPTERPNVVLFLTDDQTVSQMMALPATERLLGQGGVSFANSFVNYATCCPSRATLLTGQHASNHGVEWNSPPTGGFQGFENQDTTMAVALENAGYHTIHIGKFLNGYGFFKRDRVTPPGWSDFQALVAPSSGQYFGFTIYDDGDLLTFGPNDYLTDVTADRAVTAIDTAVEAGKPFLLDLWFSAPHAEFGSPLAERTQGSISEEVTAANQEFRIQPPIAAPRHVGDFAGARLPEPPAFDEADIRDKPDYIKIRSGLTPDKIAVIEDNWIAELESLRAVDEAVVQVMTHLDKIGQLDNTVFLFTSDNGFYHGEHRITLGKYSPYEAGIRVPLLMRGPGIPVGQMNASMVSNVDIAPTILDVAGVESLREMDGVSLLDTLDSPADDGDRAIFIEGRSPSNRDRPMFDALRSPEFFYAEYNTGEREMYDLVADPNELKNLVDDPGRAPQRKLLAATLERLRNCAGPACAEIKVE